MIAEWIGVHILAFSINAPLPGSEASQGAPLGARALARLGLDAGRRNGRTMRDHRRRRVLAKQPHAAEYVGSPKNAGRDLP